MITLRQNNYFNIIVSRFFSKERAGKGIKPRVSLVLDGEPHRVMKLTQGKRGKGGGFVRAFLKNLVSGQSFEKTFTSDELVEIAELRKIAFQYSWSDGNNFTFINSTNFEEIQVSKDIIDNYDLLSEGQDVKLTEFNNKIIGVELPILCDYEVIKIDTSRSSALNNLAIINTGAEIMVPEFIEVGSKIKVNTEERTYVEKVLE